MYNGASYFILKNQRGSVTFCKDYIFLSKKAWHKDHTIKHEYGHTIQSKWLGWLYLLVIGLPSIIWAFIHSNFSTGKKYEDLVNAMKMTLVMDTSNQYLGIGLYRGDEKLEAILVNESKRQSEYAIPKLQEILEHQNVSLMDIDEMVITKGPGSYTGVRVAMTIAKTFAVIAPVKIKVVSSLAAYSGNSKAISIIDARSHKLFVGVFDQGKNIVEDQLMSIDEFDHLRKRYPDYKIVGDGELVGVESDNSQLVDNIFALSKKEEPVEQPDLLVPQYIKEVEAKKACY